jgi:hypothetical protein
MIRLLPSAPVVPEEEEKDVEQGEENTAEEEEEEEGVEQAGNETWQEITSDFLMQLTKVKVPANLLQFYFIFRLSFIFQLNYINYN